METIASMIAAGVVAFVLLALGASMRWPRWLTLSLTLLGALGAGFLVGGVWPR